MRQKKTIEKKVMSWLSKNHCNLTTVFSDIKKAQEYIEHVGDEAILVLSFDGGEMYSVMNGEGGYNRIEDLNTD